MPLRRNLVALLLIGGFACARGGAAANSAGQSQEAGIADQSAAQLIGEWLLASDPPQPLPGLRIGFTVDSARGAAYHGRLSLYFAGNVGGRPDDFEPFSGSVGRDGTVTFRAQPGDPAAPSIMLVGPLRADTIHVTTLVVGADTLSGQHRSWFLVKR